jgi:hypothetical protein
MSRLQTVAKHALDFIINFELQVWGIVALWAYTEILQWRNSNAEQAMWRHRILLVMGLSLTRLLLVQSTRCVNAPDNNSHWLWRRTHPWIQACENPPKAISQFHQTFNSAPEKLLGMLLIGYGLFLDIILQVAGMAVIWGSSEWSGARHTGENSHWAKATMACSFASLIRYSAHINYYYTLNVLNKKDHYFLMGLCDAPQARDTLKHALQHDNMVVSYSDGYAILSGGDELEERVLNDSQVRHLLFGFVTHCLFIALLEIDGSGSAFWGVSDMLGWRTNADTLADGSPFAWASLSISMTLGAYMLAPFIRNKNIHVITKNIFSCCHALLPIHADNSDDIASSMVIM